MIISSLVILPFLLATLINYPKCFWLVLLLSGILCVANGTYKFKSFFVKVFKYYIHLLSRDFGICFVVSDNHIRLLHNL